jgi:predicted peroxiredoxin
MELNINEYIIPKEVEMGTLLCVGTYATDDPTRATMPFIAAAGALERGHKPKIVLMGEAVYLLKAGVAESIQGVGFPPLSEFIMSMKEHGVPFYL